MRLKLAFAALVAAGAGLAGGAGPLLALAAGYNDQGAGGAGVTVPQAGADIPWALAAYLLLAAAGLLVIFFVVSRRESSRT